jgi:hypothetical protein
MSSATQLVSVLGSLLVLLAYVANQFGWLQAKGLAYAIANIVGSGILAVVATLEAQWGFLLLEAAWASVSVVAAVRHRGELKEHHERRSSGEDHCFRVGRYADAGTSGEPRLRGAFQPRR